MFPSSLKSHVMKTQMFALLMLSTVTAYPQSGNQPEKFKNVRWYQMVMTRYKAESVHKAGSFIEQYFVPVDKELGRNVIKFESPFGEYDEVAYFPIDNIDELNYKIPPSGLKWMQVFIKQQGQDKAMKLLQEFEGYIEMRKTMLVRQTE